MAERKSSAHEVKLVSNTEYVLLKKHYKALSDLVTNLYRVGPKGYLVSEQLRAGQDEISTFPLRSDDIFIVSYPRSGATWTKEMVWLLCNGLDFKQAKSVLLDERVLILENRVLQQLGENNPNLEFDSESPDSLITKTDKNLKTPEKQRIIHTHLPMSLLPTTLLNTAKVIYVARDMRDVAVSCFYFYKDLKLVGLKTNNFKTYYEEIFSKDLCPFSPYFEHVKEGWELRNQPNMLFLLYEDLSKDLKNVAKRVADFLGQAYSDEEYDQLCDHLQFDNFLKNQAVDCQFMRQLKMFEGQNFIRKGKVGGWRDYFDEQMEKHAVEWITKEFQGTGLNIIQ